MQPRRKSLLILLLLIAVIGAILFGLSYSYMPEPVQTQTTTKVRLGTPAEPAAQPHEYP